ncbi:MAG TPA: phosphatase PAP2 family protein [Ilumatobacteraceae bacterium]|nr:phosphatase PAP2 family protein [Ilumatobacteraceae bacterium]
MDGALFRWINRLANRTGWAHGVVTAYAKYGIALFALLLLATYVDGRRHDDVRAVAGSVWAAGATLIALGIGQVIGGSIDRARPYEAMTGIHLLIDKTTDFSFPSDHATVAGAVAAGLMFTNRRWGSVAAALAVVMAFARVYVGAHYPGDVLAGLALGAAVAAVGRLVAVPQLTRVVAWLSRTAVRPIVTHAPHSTQPV